MIHQRCIKRGGGFWSAQRDEPSMKDKQVTQQSRSYVIL